MAGMIDVAELAPGRLGSVESLLVQLLYLAAFEHLPAVIAQQLLEQMAGDGSELVTVRFFLYGMAAKDGRYGVFAGAGDAGQRRPGAVFGDVQAAAGQTLGETLAAIHA